MPTWHRNKNWSSEFVEFSLRSSKQKGPSLRTSSISFTRCFPAFQPFSEIDLLKSNTKTPISWKLRARRMTMPQNIEQLKMVVSRRSIIHASEARAHTPIAWLIVVGSLRRKVLPTTERFWENLSSLKKQAFLICSNNVQLNLPLSIHQKETWTQKHGSFFCSRLLASSKFALQIAARDLIDVENLFSIRQATLH